MAASRASGIGWWIMAVLSALIALASARYLVPGAPGAAPTILTNATTRYGALTVHAGFAVAALLIGPFQFAASLRRRQPAWHRRAGTAYVICCLIGGLAGLVLAFGSTAGPIATAGFALLAVAWLTCTAQAWRMAKARRFADHERWMVRSFALTFAAVTLRLYIPAGQVLGLDFMAAYRAIAWLCWVPNLVVAELLIVRGGLRTSRLP